MSSQLAPMQLNHLSFPSNDVVATASFFETYLGCTATPFGRSRLLKRPGFDIVIEDATDHPIQWPRNFHLGLELPTLAALQDTYEKFKTSGAKITTELFYHVRGSRFFCEAPGGLLFEINTRADAKDEYRNSFESQVATR